MTRSSQTAVEVEDELETEARNSFQTLYAD
jgi:hypothetical protein